MAQAMVTKTVRIPPDLAEKLEAKANQTGESQQGLIIKALERYLK